MMALATIPSYVIAIPPPPPAVTIPLPPPDPPIQPGDGQGKWGAKDPTLKDRGEKIALSNLIKPLFVPGHPLGFEQAAHNMRHYLDNTGTTYANQPEDIMDDIPSFQTAVHDLAKHEASAAFASASIGAGTKTTFSSGWNGFYATEKLSRDWYFALGGFSYAVAGTVTTRKAGGVWVGDLAYKVYIFDRYNWDGGKSVQILGVTVTDKAMGRLHVVGLAREYIVRGTSKVFSVSGWNGKSGSLPSPVTGGRG